jgi:protein-tyrosine phosphatase
MLKLLLLDQPMPAPSILFVCLGNICRSPLAEGIYRHLAAGTSEKPVIASAGIGNWHIGNPPDRRSIKAAAANGIDISRQRARQVQPQDFGRFDLVVAMDRSNLASLNASAAGRDSCPASLRRARIREARRCARPLLR